MNYTKQDVFIVSVELLLASNLPKLHETKSKCCFVGINLLQETFVEYINQNCKRRYLCHRLKRIKPRKHLLSAVDYFGGQV